MTVIRSATMADAQALADLYNPYIEDSTVTFEEQVIDAPTMAGRLAAVKDAGLPWLLAESTPSLLGFAYATPWKPRSAYRFSVEISVYVARAAQGRGWGTRLYEALFQRLEPLGVHAVLGGITLPNAASVALHEKFGMVQVAHLREVGFKFGEWRDVGYWQRILGPPDDSSE